MLNVINKLVEEIGNTVTEEGHNLSSQLGAC